MNQPPPSSVDIELSAEEARRKDPNRRFGREIAYGIQQSIACWATDFIDPVISKWYQKNHGNQQHEVTDVHTWGGEIAGDSAALVAYLAAKRFFSKPIDMVIGGVKHFADSKLSKMGKKAISPWAEAHGIDENDSRYQRKLAIYKDYQAENVVDSAIIAASATGLNVLAQKHLFKNQQNYSTILNGKLLGAGLTFGLMAGLRIIFPNATKALDNELDDRYISPVIKAAKKTLGINEENDDKKAIDVRETPSVQSRPYSLTAEKRDGLLAMVAEHAAKIDVNIPEQWNDAIAKQKAVYHAFIDVLAADGYLAQVMEREHFEVLEKNYKTCVEHGDMVTRSEDRAMSHSNVQAAMARKRADMQAFLSLLDDPEFLAEAKQAALTGNIPERKNHELTDQDKDFLTSSLLQKTQGRRDPAQAIFDQAEEQVLEHQALAHTVQPDGIVTRIMAAELKKRLPDYDAKDVEGIAKDYMQYYHQEENIMISSFKADSDIVQQAIERANNLSEKYKAPAGEMSYTLAS